MKDKHYRKIAGMLPLVAALLCIFLEIVHPLVHPGYHHDESSNDCHAVHTEVDSGAGYELDVSEEENEELGQSHDFCLICAGLLHFIEQHGAESVSFLPVIRKVSIAFAGDCFSGMAYLLPSPRGPPVC